MKRKLWCDIRAIMIARIGLTAKAHVIQLVLISGNRLASQVLCSNERYAGHIAGNKCSSEELSASRAFREFSLFFPVPESVAGRLCGRCLRQIGVGTAHWLAPPLPPNRPCGSPANGSPVSSFPLPGQCRWIKRNTLVFNAIESAVADSLADKRRLKCCPLLFKSGNYGTSNHHPCGQNR